MAKKESLFKLIKSLKKSEKRYFSIFAQKYKGKESALLKLFGDIDKQNEYDEKALKESFGSSFAVLKNRLYNTLLLVLRQQNKESNPRARIQDLIETASLLSSRGFEEEAFEYLKKARQQTEKIQQYELWLEIATISRRILRVENNKSFKLFLSDIRQKSTEIFKILQNKMEYNKLADEVYVLYRQNTPESHEKLDRILDHPLLSDLNQALSDEAKLDFLNIQVIYAHVNAQKTRALKKSLELLEFLEKRQYLQEVYPHWYLTCINNFLVASVEFEEEIDFMWGMNLLKDFKTKNKKLNYYLQRRIFEIYYSCKLARDVHFFNIEEGLSHVSEIEKGIQKFYDKGLSWSRIVRMRFGLALLFFYTGKFEQALNTIQPVLNEERQMGASWLLGYIKILEILLHIELDNIRLAYSLCRRTKHYFNTHCKPGVADIEALKILKQYTNPPNIYRRDKIILSALDTINSIPHEENSVIFEYLKFHYWLKSRLEHKTIADLVIHALT